MTTTNYSLLDDRMAADFLGVSVAELRRLHGQGVGPRAALLPNGQSRYRMEDLQSWAFSPSSGGGVTWK